MNPKTIRTLTQFASGLALFAFSIFPSATLALAAGAWSATGSMATPRVGHTATLLTNGKVLVVNGGTSVNLPSLMSAELYDPATGLWSPAGSTTNRHEWSTATQLANGKVLVTGSTTVEIYNPDTNTWSTTGAMAIWRTGHTATLLPDSRVLVTGGGFDRNSSAFIASAEIYDPATGVWSSTSAAPPIYQNTATLLANGKVLLTGGVNPFTGHSVTNAYLYDPATDTWNTTGAMTTARSEHTATMLPDGRVLVAGGLSQFITASAEIYDPSTGAWSATNPMTAATSGHTATLLANGKVLVLLRGSNTAEIYDPATGNWSLTASTLTDRVYPTATLLTNGKVLVVGGNSSNGILASAELYDENPPTAIRIEAGGNANFTDHTGKVWLSDRNFTGGNVVDRGNVIIANTLDPKIYQTERYGMSAFAYNLPNGIYQINLHFAETYDGITGSGQRVFSVNVEGTPINNIDIFAQAGGRNKALIRAALVQVTDGQLNISFSASSNNAEINGIEIIPNGPIRVEAGGGTHFIDHNGDTWLSDRAFTGGSMVDRGNIAIANTLDPNIYQTERYGMTSFAYNVPNGTYTVKLHFAETYFNAANMRIFNVNVEGTAINGLDVWTQAGGQNKALVKTVTVNVADGILTINFTAITNSPEINGIEIIPAP
jgi:hypothetical protein